MKQESEILLKMFKKEIAEPGAVRKTLKKNIYKSICKC